MSYILGDDPETLREKVDLPAQRRERLDEIGEQRSLPALLERVWLAEGPRSGPRSASSSFFRAVRARRAHGGTRKDLRRARIPARHGPAAARCTGGGHPSGASRPAPRRRREQRWASIAAFALAAPRRGAFRRRRLRGRPRRLQEGALPTPGVRHPSDDQLESTLLAIDTVDRRRTKASASLAG